MAINITDFSSAGGNNVLKRTFEEGYLFDASTFYNWEQDNIPLAKLIERTNLLHQYAGYPGEEYKPTTMTLSSVADEANGIYDNMDDIIARIPNRLSFPLLIELCTYGDLGAVTFNDITTVGQGKLEVRNQNYGYGPSAVTKTVAALTAAAETEASINDQITNPSGTTLQFSALTKIHSPNEASGLQGSIKAVSSVRLGEIFYNGTALAQQDTVTKNYFTTVFAQKAPDTNNEADRMYFSKGAEFTATDEITINPYKRSIDKSIVSSVVATRTDFAPRTQSGFGENLEIRRVQLDDDNEAAATYGKNRLSVAMYGNYFRGVTVKNCNGDIKFTNICVDGASGTDSEASFLLSHNTEHGFDVNSSDIVLQNAAVCRTRSSGFRFRNSEIGVLGNMIAYRVYPKNTDGTRSKKYFGTGLKSNNSTIVFSDTALGTGVLPAFNRFQVTFAKNDIGIQLNNSTIEGGTFQDGQVRPNAGGLDYNTGIIQSYQNYLYGVESINSELNYLGRWDVFNNREGFKLLNSVMRSPQFTSDDNQGLGINLEGSQLVYGYRGDELYGYTAGGNYRIPNGGQVFNGTWLQSKPAFAVSYNGQNLRAANNSSVKPWYQDTNASSIPDYMGNWGGQSIDYYEGRNNTDNAASGSFATWHGSEYSRYKNDAGYNGGSATDVPCVVVEGNSDVELVNFCAAAEENSPGKGRIAYATDGSKVAFRGTNASNTTFFLDTSGGTIGSQARVWTSSPICADNGSTIELTGPTKISRFGVGALADNNSLVKFTTPSNGAIPEVVKYGLLDSRNHTQVEVHSSRACFVANKNSGIILENLGGFPFGFVSSVPGAAGQGTAPSSISVKYSGLYKSENYITSSLWWSSCSGAYMQTYPNGFSTNTPAAYNAATSATGKAHRQSRLLVDTASEAMDNVTTGGMVARAVNGSYIDVLGVNFKMDVNKHNLSGVVYNPTNYGREQYPDGEPGNDWLDQDTSGGFQGNGGGGAYEGGMGQGNQYQYNFSSDCSQMPPIHFQASSFGTRLHIWNIADTSRIKAQDVLINGNNPYSECVSKGYHGPSGKWGNGVALDYFGEFGAAQRYAMYTPGNPANNGEVGAAGFQNYGIFRLMLGHRGDVKTFYGVSSDLWQNSVTPTSGSHQYTFGADGEGWALDQINSQGYMSFFGQGNSLPGALSNGAQGRRYFTQINPATQDRFSTSGADYVFGFGLPAGTMGVASYVNPDINYYTPASFNPGSASGMDINPYILNTESGLTNMTASPAFAIPPLHGDWQGYMRNFVDESGACLFQNAKHLATRQIGGISIYRSTVSTGGEGRDGSTTAVDFSPGVRSLNIFDLDSLV